ncbi:MAG: beta-glucosidase [Polyangia bacterium]
MRLTGSTAHPAAGGRSGEPLFSEFFLGGFECSCHVLEDGRRLDLTAATRHDELADGDYARASAAGLRACRDGVSWVRAEAQRGKPDFRHALPLLRAATRHGVQVIWDLMHFGWPPDVDVFSPRFPARFGRYARAFAEWLAVENDGPVMVAPINEISFLSWAGGDVRCMNPFAAARGVELKVQLVRATIEAIEGIRDVIPGARFLQPEPAIQIVPDPRQPLTWRRVESDNLLQYQAWDMLTGAVWPALGGHPRYLDIVGVNFYPNNQFMLDGTTIHPSDRRYRPFSQMLLDIWSRYRRPMIVSETGSEGDHRAPWLGTVCDQALAAIEQGCELHGITLYPVLNHPGWLDDRRCENGLWDYADEHGERAIHAPLAEELGRQGPRLRAARDALLEDAGAVAIPA